MKQQVHQRQIPLQPTKPLVFLRLPHSIALCAIYCLVFTAFLFPQIVNAQGKNAPTKEQIEEKKGDLKELREQIEALQKNMSDAQSKRTDTLGQLKEIERDISSTQREMRDLGTQRSKLQTTIKNLGRQSKDLEKTLQTQRSQLEKLIYQQYVQNSADPLRIFLSGGNSNQVARDLYYLSMIGRARGTLQKQIEVALQQKRRLETDTRQRIGELSEIENAQKEKHVKFVSQREQRKVVLQKMSTQIAQQRREIGNLQKNEKQLSTLVEKLSKIIASKPPPPPPSRPQNMPSSKPTPQIDNDKTPEATVAGNFARMKGELRLPVKGTLTNRFGTARQEGGLWKGLFIRTPPGADIKSIAGGRVVFADWMRGFGNLMIVDHGSGYLSIYGNNESLLKQPGDEVQGGDVIALAGNSGGNPESGLYFELRHKGQPVDPIAWVNLK